MATEKYVNGTGLGYLWTKIKNAFLITSEENKSPLLITRPFATIDDTYPHGCGNSVSGMQSGSRILIPLQVSPDFAIRPSVYVYESYKPSSTANRSHRNAYQIAGNSSLGYRLYTVPTSGDPTLVTSLSNLGSGVSNAGGFYVIRDSVHGNYWLSTTNTSITSEDFGITYEEGGDSPDPITPVTPDLSYAEIHITGTSIDADYALFDDYIGFWTCDTASAYIRFTGDLEFTHFYFDNVTTSVGESRVCNYVSNGIFNYSYNLKRTTSSSGHYITITRTKAGQAVPEI